MATSDGARSWYRATPSAPRVIRDSSNGRRRGIGRLAKIEIPETNKTAPANRRVQSAETPRGKTVRRADRRNYLGRKVHALARAEQTDIWVVAIP